MATECTGKTWNRSMSLLRSVTIPLLLFLDLMSCSNGFSHVLGKFADDLVRNLHAKDSNECSSSLGVMLALSLIYPSMTEGSDTKSQSENILGFQPDSHMFLEFKLEESSHRRPPTVLVKYSVWIDAALHLNDLYARSPASKHIHQIDFQSTSAGDEINSWVRNVTDNRIETIVPSGRLDHKFIATSAIYLKAGWKHKFKSRHTSLDRFFRYGYSELGSLSQMSSVPFMHQVEELLYGEFQGFQILQLPFSGSDTLSMVFFLKDAPGESVFSSKMYSDTVGQLQNRVVAVSLPKFRFSRSYSAELDSALRAIGWDAGFQGGLKIFESMESHVDSIIQKTFISVDEAGVEAAAVTAISTRMARRPPTDPPILFQADRPFQFFIVDSSTVIFEGCVVNPTWPSVEEEPKGDSHDTENYWTSTFGVQEPERRHGDQVACEA